MGVRYASFVVDGYSHKIFAEVTPTKADTADHVIELHRRSVVTTGKKLKRLHSDGGGEYRSQKLIDYMRQQGVTVTSTVAHTPQHNGVAERAIRIIVEKARSMMEAADVPIYFWGEAILTAVYVTNRCTSNGSGNNNCTVEDLWSGNKPSVKHLRVFGCDVFIHIPEIERVGAKMEAKAKKGIFLGYEEKKMGYRCYVPAEKKIIISRDCIFHENSFSVAHQLREELLIDRDQRDANEEELRVARIAANDVTVPPTSSTRHAARAASHRFVQPWDEERAFQREMKIVQEISKVEEEERQKKLSQEEGEEKKEKISQSRNREEVVAEEVPCKLSKPRKHKSKPKKGELKSSVTRIRTLTNSNPTKVPSRRSVGNLPQVDYGLTYFTVDSKAKPITTQIIEPIGGRLDGRGGQN